jgi:predicted XRE-type DNA-binding protein
MNKLLNIYHLGLDFLDVSGAEQLELLMIRDQIAGLEIELNAEEQSFYQKQIESSLIVRQKFIKNFLILSI